jgi:hypothetical protein
VLEYTLYLELEPGTDIEFFRGLFTQEFIDIPDYSTTETDGVAASLQVNDAASILQVSFVTIERPG